MLLDRPLAFVDLETTGGTTRGEVLHGTIESPNTQAVASWMLDSGIAPINIEILKDKKGRQPVWLLALQVSGAINIRERLLFTRQMCTMIKSGVPMMQALAGIQKSTTNPVLVDVLQDVRANLDKGVELSGAFDAS